MKLNVLPKYDMSDNPTGCCPRFDPESWQDVELHFADKPFVRAETKSVMHVPVNMGKVFGRVMAKLEPDFDEDNYIVLSRDPNAWKGEHLFASDKPVEGEEMVTLSGDFVTAVFEGSFRQTGDWYDVMKAKAAGQGNEDADVWFFYTTCPKCAKVYGKNYVVGLAKV
ncbi:MAG: hypothetical protein GY945_02705 [Rhodobacteraceae bacterium]|nr:hypothetical protein [Paracoccaceae bacterium]